MNDKSTMRVYYNSACPVCKAGIEMQMKKDNLCRIQWKDVHKDNNLASEVHSDIEYVRERLHLIDENGDLQIGFNAFLAIWRNSPRDTWKARILGLPVFRQAGQGGYNIFAAALYKWNISRRHW